MLLLLQLNNLLEDAGSGPSFIGPDISDLNLTQNQAMAPIDFSTRFTGVTTFTLQGGAVTGLSLSSGGVLSGTPTVVAANAGRSIQADGSINSNTFTINVNAPIAGGGSRSWRRRPTRRFN